MPVVRAVVGTLLLLLAVPLVLVGGGLAAAEVHRGPAGAYTATLAPVHVDGYAAVVPDVDALLRADVPFARGGQTTLRISVTDPGGALVVGLARRSDVDAYLAGVEHTTITRVGLARGALPTQTVAVPGTAQPPVVPTAARFWVTRATGLYRDGHAEDPLTWSPSSLRNAHLAMVIMRADGSSGLDLTVRAALVPGWLTPTTWGLLTLGTCLLLLGVGVVVWPRRRRDVMYVVDPARVPDVAARLGVTVPADAAGSLRGSGGSDGSGASASLVSSLSSPAPELAPLSARPAAPALAPVPGDSFQT